MCHQWWHRVTERDGWGQQRCSASLSTCTIKRSHSVQKGPAVIWVENRLCVDKSVYAAFHRIFTYRKRDLWYPIRRQESIFAETHSANDMVFCIICDAYSKCGNVHRCTSFPPINYQTGINKTHGQQAEYIKCLSCLLLNQLCNYLKDVLIVACSTLNISQRFSSALRVRLIG